MSIITMSDLLSTLRKFGKRGTVRETGLNSLEVCVPFWRIRAVRAALCHSLPAYVQATVKPLSVLGHLLTRGFERILRHPLG